MCGYFCIFGPESNDTDRLEIKNLNKILNHRGPDDFRSLKGENFNTYFWRLSIVDRENGRQPMTSFDGDVSVLFNGEIYNFQEIKKDISINYNFSTLSDTEIILAAYKQWGTNCFNYFEGMFAIMLIDHSNNKIIVSRDYAGVKPLYYCYNGRNLFFSSEYKVFLDSNIISNDINYSALKEYIIFQTVQMNENLIKGVKKVMPGEIIEFDLNTLKVINTNRIKLKEFEKFKNYNDYFDCLKNEIYHQMTLATNTDLPTGYHLSGGIDSNTLVSLTKSIRTDQNFFFVTSIIDDESDNELGFINQAAKKYERELKVVKVNSENFFDTLDDAIYQLDEPVGDPGLIPQYLVNKKISEHAKIVYSGQGFDELFFGYARNLAAYVTHVFGIEALASKNDQLPKPISKFFSDWSYFKTDLINNQNLSPEMINFTKLCRFNPYLSYDKLNVSFVEDLKKVAKNVYFNLHNQSKSFSDFLFLSETTIQLPSLLQMEDRVSMIHSVETRVPFCTNSIISLARKGQMSWIFKDHKTKGVIKDIVKNLIPSEILNRPNKVGRPVPFRSWFKSKRDLGLILEDNREKIEFIYRSKNILNYALNNQNPYDRTLWGIWSLIRWLDRYNVTL